MCPTLVQRWGRSIFGTLKDAGLSSDPPIFIPVLFGERSPEWNPQLTGPWHGLTARRTTTDLSRSILEAVIFNVAYFVDIVQSTSGHTLKFSSRCISTGFCAENIQAR
jgi:sugar (pentulose or hexulose) kinase